MATINLGSIKFNWKGAYNNSTAYAVDDVVSSSGNSYVCIQASQGNAVGNATAYWNIMSSAGAAGAEGGTTTLTTRGDLLTRGASAVARLAKGTEGQVLGQGANDPAWVNGSAKTLTTQGDLLYRDGSGLQRLAKGTAGQVLQMNSGANAPEYADASGGSWTLVSTTTASNNSYVDITFSGSYSIYKITFVNMIGPDNQNINHQFLIGGSVVGSNYKYGNIFIDSNGGTGTHSSGSANSAKMTYAPMGAATGDNTSGTVTIYNPGSGLIKNTDWTFNGTQKTGSYMNKNVGGSSSSGANTAWSGFRVLYSSGNIASGVMKLWGQA